MEVLLQSILFSMFVKMASFVWIPGISRILLLFSFFFTVFLFVVIKASGLCGKDKTGMRLSMVFSLLLKPENNYSKHLDANVGGKNERK